MLELYNFSQSTCSLKVRILLEEKGLEWTDRRLVSKDHDHLSDWYLKLNPNGVVPTLIHDGRPVFEFLGDPAISRGGPSGAVVQPGGPLWPGADARLAHLRRPRPDSGDPLSVVPVRRAAAEIPGDERRGVRREGTRRPLKGAFYRKMDKEHGFEGAELDEAYEDIRKTAKRMDWMFEREWRAPGFSGRNIRSPTSSVAPLLDRIEDLGLEALWEEFLSARCGLAHPHPGAAGLSPSLLPWEPHLRPLSRNSGSAADRTVISSPVVPRRTSLQMQPRRDGRPDKTKLPAAGLPGVD